LRGIADIAALARLAHDAGALLVVDNTFATAYLQTPLAFGADLVVHSTTKYCGGHCDVVGGAGQMRRFGGMVSFRLRGLEDALSVCRRTEVFTLAESQGGVESLIEHPARMTHAWVAGSALEVPTDLVRLSVGIQDAEDLLADLDRPLS